MEQWKGKVAIVTGASVGIGAAIAQTLVHHGMIVVGLARRKEKILGMADEFAKDNEPGKLHGLMCDMTKEEDILASFEWVEKELGGADVLVNNAGVFVMDNIQEGKTEDWLTMLKVNVLGTCICTREFLKSMDKRKNQQGHIVFINSIAGHVVLGAIGGVYSGTKHALTAITQSLRKELAEKNSTIKVTSISPGFTKSEAMEKFSYVLEETHAAAMEGSDIGQAVVDVLSASRVTQICEVIMTPIPFKQMVY